jgi:hypothetical protein
VAIKSCKHQVTWPTYGNSAEHYNHYNLWLTLLDNIKLIF